MFELRRPEYTGENRCLPCTVVNAVLALVVAIMLAGFLWWVGSPPVGLALGGAVLLVAALSIWLRGYLVPGTPELTRRYLPDRVLGWFGKDPLAQRGLDETQARSDLEVILANAGVLRPCAFKDDLCLTGGFKAELRDAIENGADDTDDLLRALSIDPSEASIEERGDGRVLQRGRRRLATWPSASALSVDIATASLVPERVAEWDELSPLDRSRVIMGTRIFLEECPDEGGPVELQSETVKSCCSEREVIAGVCADSGVRLFEQPLD